MSRSILFSVLVEVYAIFLMRITLRVNYFAQYTRPTRNEEIRTEEERIEAINGDKFSFSEE